MGVLAALAVMCPSVAQADVQVPDTWRAGVNLTNWSPDGYAMARPALEAARAAGATSVSLVPTLYVDDASDSTVEPNMVRTPTDASLIQAAADAHELGLAVTLKPHVDALDGTFRGDLQPVDRQAWFASYDRWLDHYARLAQRIGAETLVVGTELDSLATDHAAFSALIATARSSFHHELTYASNWDVVSEVPFWSELDLIGVDAYVPLADAQQPAVNLRARWEPLMTELATLHAQTGKPVAFTELGYQSRSDALVTPFNASGPSDQAVQARAYEAAFAVWSSVPWFRGISWWDWSAEAGAMSAEDGGFSARGKQAEQVLRRWTLVGTPVAPPQSGGGAGGLFVALLVAALGLTAAAASFVALRRRRPAVEVLTAVTCDDEALALLVQARAVLDSGTAVLFLRDTFDPRLARVAMGVGVPQDLVGAVLSSDEGLMGHVLVTGNPIAVANYAELPAPIRHPFATEARAALSVPVRRDGYVIGALTVGRDDQYAPSERHLLTPLADQIALLLPPQATVAPAPLPQERRRTLPVSRA